MTKTTAPSNPQTRQSGLKKYSGWLIAVVPLGLTLYFLTLVPLIAAGKTAQFTYQWVPSLGVSLSFYVDGLSLIFSLLISGIGALVAVYSGGYLAGHRLLGRFYLYLLLFMASMLGVVLANNLITLFVFWELTSLTSYLLIGFNHEQEISRQSALQALLVTGAGGLALLAGLLLLGGIGQSWDLTSVLNQGDLIRAHPLYLPLMILVLLGAFTKSAQVPFHFWLPNAMVAPTPVSAYLHSATMVTAGVYLLARLDPALGGTFAWHFSLVAVGTMTMVLAAYVAWQQTDLKRILAYSTVSALGTLVMLIGLGTPAALKAAVVFLIVHSLYKGALFMAAGSVDHETGTRNITQLSGLHRLMPITFVAVVLAALSMMGALPLFIGYIGKKLIYEATLATPPLVSNVLTSAAVLANALTIVAAGLAAHRPFFGPKLNTPKHPHEAPPGMWLGPMVLAIMGLALVLVIELWPDNPLEALVVAAAQAMYDDVVKVKLSAWSGLNLEFFLSLLTLALGIALYVIHNPLVQLVRPLNIIARWGPEQWYNWLLAGMLKVAGLQTRILQNGYLRYYLMTIVLTTVVLIGYTLFNQVDLTGLLTVSEVRFYELVIVGLILAATLMVVFSRSRLAAVVALGVVGYNVALIYILFNAPDLGMTQIAIETLGVILLVLILYRLPRFTIFTGISHRLRDGAIALAAGVMMTGLVLIADSVSTVSQITPFFAENSLATAKGRNVVNVILVDFRGLDTLGEITVLAVAAIGVYDLLRLRLGQAPKEPGKPEATAVSSTYKKQPSNQGGAQ
jgi:multicomponent Na+:H+ antiporter subunit A